MTDLKLSPQLCTIHEDYSSGVEKRGSHTCKQDHEIALETLRLLNVRICTVYEYTNEQQRKTIMLRYYCHLEMLYVQNTTFLIPL